MTTYVDYLIASLVKVKLISCLKFLTRSHWFVAIVCFPEKFDPINKPSRQLSKSSQQQSDNASDKLEIDSGESVGDGALVVFSTPNQLVSTEFYWIAVVISLFSDTKPSIIIYKVILLCSICSTFTMVH